MVSKQIVACAVVLLGACGYPREHVITGVGKPWRDARVSADGGKASARLSDVTVGTVVPLDEFPGLRPRMTPVTARATFGEPSHTRQEADGMVYVYSSRAGDVEIVERETPTESGTPAPQPARWYEVRVRPRAPIESEALSRLLERLSATEPAVRLVVVSSNYKDDPVVDLYVQDGKVTAFTVH